MLSLVLARCKSTAAILSSFLILPAFVLGQSAERPPSDELLPETTVAYIQIHNVREFVEKMQETNMGQMIADDRIAPLIGDVGKTVEDAYSEVEDKVGLSLDELKSLPAGEICFAVIAPKRKTPAFVLIIDMDEESETVEKALQRGRDFAAENEVEFEEEEGEEVTYEKFSVDGNQFMFFQKGGTFVIGTDKDELDGIVERWAGRDVEKIKPLKENRKFITIMNRCKGSKDLPADMRFFVDPINLAKSATRGNTAAQLGLNMLPVLGLDGFLGAGGAAIMDEMDFESVSHFHVLLANPRSGILEMVALKPDNYEPQDWVPGDTVNYASTSWDVQKMLNEIEKMYDSFNGEGALNEQIEDEINEELNLDFREDLIGQLSGRITWVQWIDSEAEMINGQTNAIAIGLKDPDAFRDTLDAIFERFQEENDEDDFEVTEYKGVEYWKLADSRIEEQQQRREERRERRREQGRERPQMAFRFPQPSFAILDNSLIISIEGTEFLHKAIETSRGDGEQLFENEKFEYVSEQMTKLLGTDVPGAVVYSRPEESMRWMFRVANSDDTGEFLDDIAEENKFAAGIRDAIKDNPLPDFDDVKEYFQPSGMFITNDETGYHFLGFQLKSTVDR